MVHGRSPAARWALVATGIVVLLLLVVGMLGVLRESESSVKPTATVAGPSPTATAPVASTSTPSSRPTATPPADLALGAWLFQSRGCAGCHGQKAEGAIGRRLAGTGVAFDDARRQVRFPIGEMIAYPEVALSDSDLFQIWSWLRSLSP